ncbi:hypothetical protein QQY24_27330 [Streptomyces sp. TG1A-8]|uniref:hypothetical protein n=1 Tax=Streptomyces sp. TG1A-8 TaxID=3051385 RepID=UPI00265BD978|nr:hypothetical protein [Streptomyces sp. TG1A-8]MDO0928944.1 hypothetical protein [Streptomyces sp. TG1A-8]
MEKTAEGQRDWAEATELVSLAALGPISQKFRDAFTGGEGVEWKPFRSVKR